MLRPIPRRILTHTITVKVCTAVDRWQFPTYTAYTFDRVCVQPTSETKRTADNTDVTLKSIVFIDARLSGTNGQDIAALKASSEEAGHELHIVVGGTEYTVVSIDTLYDDTGTLHHWEVGLV